MDFYDEGMTLYSILSCVLPLMWFFETITIQESTGIMVLSSFEGKSGKGGVVHFLYCITGKSKIMTLKFIINQLSVYLIKRYDLSTRSF
jgi:hypothetical protein